MAGTKLTAKRAKVGRNYETPYGVDRVERYDYQSSAGGQVHIPLEHNARIVAGATPRFAKIVSYLYSHVSVKPSALLPRAGHFRRGGRGHLHAAQAIG